jgi:putative protease
LDDVYSRGFNSAYLHASHGNEMMSYKKPNNRGSAVGRVCELSGRRVGIELSKDVRRGDMLEIWTRRGNHSFTLGDFASAAPSSLAKPADAGPDAGTARAGSVITVALDGAFSCGDRVFRLRSQAVADNVSNIESALFAGNQGIRPVDFEIELRVGQPVRMTASSDGASVEHEGALVEKALSRPLSQQDVIEHVGRVGNTPFFMRSCEVSLDEGASVRFKSLHTMRADALRELSEQILDKWHSRRLERSPKGHDGSLPGSALAQRQAKTPEIVVLVRNQQCLRAALKAGARTVYLHAAQLDTGDDALEQGEAAGSRRAPAPHAGLWLGAVPPDFDALSDGLANASPGCRIVANSLDGLAALLSQSGKGSPDGEKGALPADASIEAGPSMSLLNLPAMRLAANSGCSRVWLSSELSYTQLEDLAPAAPLPLGITVSGRQELMLARHCVLMAKGDCNGGCTVCRRRKSAHLLEDRKGYRFPVRIDASGRSHIYNAVALDLLGELPRLVSLGVTSFLVDATLLGAAAIDEEVTRTLRALDLAKRGVGSLPKREGFTTGHLFRGVI